MHAHRIAISVTAATACLSVGRNDSVLVGPFLVCEEAYADHVFLPEAHPA